MKFRYAFLGLVAMAALWTPAALADVYQLGSYCTTAGCPSQAGLSNTATVYGGFSATELTAAGASSIPAGAMPTYYADPGGVWTPVGPFATPYSNYVSWQPNTGPGNFANSSAPGFYNYFSSFNLSYLGDDPSRFVGFLDVSADDTTDVWLNGFLLSPEGALGSNVKCADGLPNCNAHLGLFVYAYELRNANVLGFSVEQTQTFTGVDYDAAFHVVPEPATLALLGSGLAIPFMALRRRWSTRAT